LSKGIFIIGTDTDVGKTLITASLGWKLSKKVNRLGIMKPFATGDKPYSNRYRSQDVAILCDSIGLTENEENVNPYYFPLPCAPYMATELLRLDQVDLNYALEKFKYLTKIYNYILIEGIGGLLVPLNSNNTLLDFIKLVKLDVIIVTTPRVGTLNHTLLTVNECLTNGISVKGIVVNKMPPRPNLIELRTPHFIEKLTRTPVIGIVPLIESIRYTIETFKTVSGSINF
jgi:dethiobiotin synthetase